MRLFPVRRASQLARSEHPQVVLLKVVARQNFELWGFRCSEPNCTEVELPMISMPKNLKIRQLSVQAHIIRIVGRGPGSVLDLGPLATVMRRCVARASCRNHLRAERSGGVLWSCAHE